MNDCIFLFRSGVRLLIYHRKTNATSNFHSVVSVTHQIVTIYKLLLRKELYYCYGIVFTLLASFVAYYDSLTRYLSGDSNYFSSSGQSD
jgi:hypothetical protein